MDLLDHPAVADWLDRFDRASAVIPDAQRLVLRTGIVEHLREVVPAVADDASVATALGELGDPVAIAKAEVDAAAAVEIEERPRVGALRLKRGAIVIIAVAVVLAVLVPGAISLMRLAGF